MWHPAWLLQAPYPANAYSNVRKWMRKQPDKVGKAKGMLQQVSKQRWTKKSKHRVPAAYQEDYWLLVHHRRLAAPPHSAGDDPYFGPYKILSVDGHCITVPYSPRLGGTLVCAAQHLKHYDYPEDVCREEWELNEEEIAALDVKSAARPPTCFEGAGCETEGYLDIQVMRPQCIAPACTKACHISLQSGQEMPFYVHKFSSLASQKQFQEPLPIFRVLNAER